MLNTSTAAVLYETMKEGILVEAESNDYGTKNLREKLKRAPNAR